MPVIAMTQETGSQGKEVAAELAEKLGLEIVYHQVIEHRLSEKLHTPEDAIHRILQGKPRLLERWRTDQAVLVTYTAEEVLAVAAKGNVLIRGWGAPWLLRQVAHALCVRIWAPIEYRIKVLKARLGLDDDAIARTLIEENDAARTRTMRALVAGEWDDASEYDLVLNTARVPVSECVRTIMERLGQPAFQETAESRAKLEALSKEAQVRSAVSSLAGKSTLGGHFVDVILDGESNEITLRGAVPTREDKERAEQAVLGVQWVSKVNNELRVIASFQLGRE